MPTKQELDISYNQLFFMEMKIGDIPINPQNILNLVIKESVLEIVPRLNATILDDGMLSEIFNLEDNHNIEIVIGTNPDADNAIKSDFMLMDYKFTPLGQNNIQSVVEISGYLNFPKLFSPVYNRSFKNKSSVSVLTSIATECGLSPVKALNMNTSDNMSWLQINQNNYKFIHHVMNRAYKANDCVLTYTDIEKKMHITSLNIETQKKETNTARFDNYLFTTQQFENEEDASAIWFNYYDYVNLNGHLNKINNYGVKYNWWNLSKNSKKTITKNSSSLAQYTFKNSERKSDISNVRVFQSNNNVHNNYHDALVQNEYYRKNLFGFSLVLNANSLSSFKLMEKINIIIPSMATYAENEINEILSGKYLIGGITYSVSKGNIFQKQILVFSDGINKSNFSRRFNNQ